jgi:predicted ATPase
LARAAAAGRRLAGAHRARPERPGDVLRRRERQRQVDHARGDRRGRRLLRRGRPAVAAAIDALDVDGIYGGAKLHAQSHGESFVALAANRFAGEGLYLLDEPEAALSVTSSLAFLEILHAAGAAGAQCIVATHSPILLALPGARILEFADGEVRPAAYDDLPQVELYRSFMAAPERFLRHLS